MMLQAVMQSDHVVLLFWQAARQAGRLTGCVQDGWKAVFDTFDTDHDGSISEPEIRAALSKVGVTDAEVASMLQQYDTNK